MRNVTLGKSPGKETGGIHISALLGPQRTVKVRGNWAQTAVFLSMYRAGLKRILLITRMAAWSSCSYPDDSAISQSRQQPSY